MPTTEILDRPGGVDGDVEIVIVDDWPELTGFGLKDAVTPVGRLLALSATVSVEPLVTAVVMELVVVDPAVTAAGDPTIEKSLAGGVTVAAGLKVATPAAQYMDFAKEPAKLWLPVVVKSW